MEETLHTDLQQDLNENNEQTTAPETEQGDSAVEENGAAEQAVPSAEQLSEELEEIKDRLLRVSAEYDNFRKRTAREKEELSAFTVSATVSGLLPVLDNFERAMEAECKDAEYAKGMELILQQFRDYLQKIGVTEIPTDIPFDPQVHNAVLHVEDESLGENEITAVLQKGYQIGDKVIRHAMVSVAN